MHKITPHLWFEAGAEEAARFYVSVFKNSKLGAISRFGDAGRDGTGVGAGDVMTVEFELDGQPVIALNGGPYFKFNESFSFVVDCETQAEADELWDKLTADGGEESSCGWLKDKYGLSWQIIPRRLMELLNDPDRAKAKRVTEAMLPMQRIDVAALERAAAG
ncbi:MAG: VOC family protein [Anaerolineales bacterium]|nr:VOC family protein [Anaerolineales bacterium]